MLDRQNFAYRDDDRHPYILLQRPLWNELSTLVCFTLLMVRTKILDFFVARYPLEYLQQHVRFDDNDDNRGDTRLARSRSNLVIYCPTIHTHHP